MRIWLVLAVFSSAVSIGRPPAVASSLTLEQLVEPSTVFENEGGTVPFALHFFIEFETLEELFTYIDEQAGRWQFESEDARQAFAADLLRRGVESRLISMVYELPRELLVTHTAEQLAEAVKSVETDNSGAIFRGESWSLDRSAFTDLLLELQELWKASINCWSGSPSIAGRVLSNWYIIDEGIELFGAEYDATEHFWQAIKYHPDVRLADLVEILNQLRAVAWADWIGELAGDQDLYLQHGYSVEFLHHNLTPERLDWFADEVTRLDQEYDLRARELQERDPGTLRFTSFESKVIWGDLADVFHLLHFFGQWADGRFATPQLEPTLKMLSRHRFDAIYLPGYESGKIGFVSPELRRLMLEIWKVKYLELERFREVIRATEGKHLLHFLNDASSADIPVPEYVGYLEEIRRLALE